MSLLSTLLDRAERSDRRAKGGVRVLDLFSGIGGFTMGAERVGCSVVGVERWEPAVTTARANGHRVVAMDVARITAKGPLSGPFDLLIGGPPCQPFSQAGPGRGRHDPRDGFSLAFRVARLFRPKRFVMENVKGLMSKRHEPYRRRLIRDLGNLYPHVGIWSLNAKFWGVPQERVRVFVWGAERKMLPPSPTHGPGTGRAFVSVRDALPRLGAKAVIARNTMAKSRSIDLVGPTVTGTGVLYTAPRPGLVYGRDREAKTGRRVTVREFEALQCFPPSYELIGDSRERYKMIANAVPPPLGAAVVGAMIDRAMMAR